MKINSYLYIRICFVFIAACCLHFQSHAQFSDTLANPYKDKKLTSWVEDYIIKTGYIKKDKKGYQLALSSTYHKDIIGLYSLHIIEKQEFDTISITLYRLHVGSEHDHPMIINQVIPANNKGTSKFKVLGESSNLESVYQLYLFFDRYSRFTIGTKEYCYHMLLQNYDNYINPY
jgi:hypothetical protein